MTHILSPIRPAGAAIAAVLALTATPLLAQEAPALPPALSPTLPNVQPMEQASPPAAPPTAAPMIATQPATPPAASLPGNPLPATAPIVPDSTGGLPVTAIAPPSSLTVPQVPAKPAARQAARSAKPVAAPVTAAPAAAPVEAEAVPSPREPISEPVIAAPITPAPSMTAEPVQPEPVTTDNSQGNGDIWAVLAGLLAALGLGGASIALTRMRTRKSAAASAASQPDHDRRQDAMPMTLSRNAMAGPHDRPHTLTAQIATPEAAPMQTVAPQVMPQPVRTPPPAPMVEGTAGDNAVDPRRLEYMISQRPSRENPFLTRGNRKRRAIFLLRNLYPMQSAA